MKQASDLRDRFDKRSAPSRRRALLAATAVAGAALAVVGFLLERWRERRAARAFRKFLTAGVESRPFNPGELQGLPAPARRYFLHALTVGAPTQPCTSLRMVGRIRPRPNGRWFPFRAIQLINPGRGFRWEATIGLGPFSLHVTDTFGRDEGNSRLWLSGLFPVSRSNGPDVNSSAYGRFVAEAIYAPAALLPSNGVRWEPVDDSHATYSIRMGRLATPVTITVDETGRLREVVLQRHGNVAPDGSIGPWQSLPFGASFLDEGTFGDVTLPRRVQAGWGFGTDDFIPSFEAVITSVTYPVE